MAAKPANQVGVFISYSHEDRFIAEMLAQRLREIGYQPWVDFVGMVGGEEWKQSINDALSRSSAFLLVLTPDSIGSVTKLVARVKNSARLSPCCSGNVK